METPTWLVPPALLDLIDVGARPSRVADAAAMMTARFAGVSTQAMLAELADGRPRRAGTAAVSSFGAESAVLLHMIAAVDRDVPDHLHQHAENVRRDAGLSRRAGGDAGVHRPARLSPRSAPARGQGRDRDCAGPTIPTAAATCARSSRYAARWRRSMPGYRAARASRRRPAPRSPVSRSTKAGSS